MLYLRRSLMHELHRIIDFKCKGYSRKICSDVSWITSLGLYLALIKLASCIIDTYMFYGHIAEKKWLTS